MAVVTNYCSTVANSKKRGTSFLADDMLHLHNNLFRTYSTKIGPKSGCNPCAVVFCTVHNVTHQLDDAIPV